MARMGPRSATALLQLPVRLRGILLGGPVDLLLDPTECRALGLVVRCRDESTRFLVFAAVDLCEDAIDVPSALLLLEDVEFYRHRSRSLLGLLGGTVVSARRELGELRDLLLTPNGTVAALVAEHDDGIRQVRPAGASVESERVSTA